MPRLKINGLELNVSELGEGTPILLLHGFPDSVALWRRVTPHLVASGYRVIAIDQRGFGDSDAPLGKANYSISTIADDALAVLNVLGVQRAHVVGHDWGAAVGWFLSGNHPSRVASLTALSLGHSRAYAAAGLAQLRKTWYILLFLIPGVAERVLPAWSWKLFYRSARHPECERWVAHLSRPGRLTAAMNWYRANALSPEPHPNLAVPVLGVWSDQDVALTEAQMVNSAEFVAGRFCFERLEGVSHWIPLDAPDELARLLFKFHRECALQPPTDAPQRSEPELSRVV